MSTVLGYIEASTIPEATVIPKERLLERRYVFVLGPIDTMLVDNVMREMLALYDENPTEDIRLVINSGGGSVSGGLAIYDLMQLLPCDIATVGIGQAASMAAVLLAGGTHGKRFAAPNLNVLIHQPLIPGGLGGTAADLEIEIGHLNAQKQRLFDILSLHTGKTTEEIHLDADRDLWLTPQEALDYGVVDSLAIALLPGLGGELRKEQPAQQGPNGAPQGQMPAQQGPQYAQEQIHPQQQMPPQSHPAGPMPPHPDPYEQPKEDYEPPRETEEPT